MAGQGQAVGERLRGAGRQERPHDVQVDLAASDLLDQTQKPGFFALENPVSGPAVQQETGFPRQKPGFPSSLNRETRKSAMALKRRIKSRLRAFDESPVAQYAEERELVREELEPAEPVPSRNLCMSAFSTTMVFPMAPDFGRFME